MDPVRDDLEDRIEQAKLEAIKELAYGASHEINNPLANISARAQTLLREERDPERRRALEAIDQQALRAHEMISDLMLFARPPKLVYEAFVPAELTDRVIEEFQDEAKRRNVGLAICLDEAPPLAWGDPVQWGVALQSLIRNALEAIGENGEISLNVDAMPIDATPANEAQPEQQQSKPVGVRWTVVDNGPGISHEVRARIFDPFFSGREAGRGLGFGLSKCWRIVSEHQGRIDVESSEHAGARIALLLPAKPAAGDAPRRHGGDGA